MLAIIGDIHGNFRRLKVLHDKAKSQGAAAIIQVGDFGFYPRNMASLADWEFDVPIFAIDGNHEHFPMLRGVEAVQEQLAKNLSYVPRGTVLELDGRTIGFLGGGASIDKDYRIANGWSWFPDELITSADCQRLLDNAAGKSLDFLVTHCPPQWVIKKHFDDPDPTAKCRYFGVPIDWYDPSADKVEAVWNALGQLPLYCGHMHRAVSDNNVRILDCDEMILV